MMQGLSAGWQGGPRWILVGNGKARALVVVLETTLHLAPASPTFHLRKAYISHTLENVSIGNVSLNMGCQQDDTTLNH